MNLKCGPVWTLLLTTRLVHATGCAYFPLKYRTSVSLSTLSLWVCVKGTSLASYGQVTSFQSWHQLATFDVQFQHGRCYFWQNRHCQWKRRLSPDSSLEFTQKPWSPCLFLQNKDGCRMIVTKVTAFADSSRFLEAFHFFSVKNWNAKIRLGIFCQKKKRWKET